MYSKMMVVVGLVLVAAQVYAAPMDSCGRQANCLTVTGSGIGSDDTCSADGMRTVCMKWSGSDDCVKSASDTISHSCPVVNGYGDDANTKIEGWAADTEMCVQVKGGDTAQFGVKDGSSCSGAGVYNLASGLEGLCEGPGQICEGGNRKECGWNFATAACVPPPEPPVDCGDDLMCSVQVPCGRVAEVIAALKGEECA